MVKKSSIFLICCISVCSLKADFVDSDVGRQFVALIDKSGRGLVKGEVYEITQVNTTFHALHTGGGVGIDYSHKGLFWDWSHDFTMNQQLIDCIAFSTGILTFYAFARGFNSPLSI